jgi:hypothetical protein
LPGSDRRHAASIDHDQNLHRFPMVSLTGKPTYKILHKNPFYPRSITDQDDGIEDKARDIVNAWPT